MMGVYHGTEHAFIISLEREIEHQSLVLMFEHHFSRHVSLPPPSEILREPRNNSIVVFGFEGLVETNEPHRRIIELLGME